MDIAPYIDLLRAYVEERRFAGYDPYDALNSPFLRLLSSGTKWGRIACIQALRGLPVNLRPLLLIRPAENPKALGLFLEGYARLHRCDPRQEYADAALHLIRRLRALRTRTPNGYGWGYPFDWQSRAFFLPKFTPTVVCSSFVAHALLDAAEAFDAADALELAAPAAEFFLHDLRRIPDGHAFCFSYSPFDTYAVHNANLLGASVLIRLSRLSGLDSAREAALAALAYTMNHQREDGSWYYSEAGTAHWVDSFHTGFNLECIRRFLQAGEASQYRRAYERGVRFYADRFFLADGTPKYYAGQTYPIDVHAAATAISYFAGEGASYAVLLERLVEFAVRRLWNPRGFFYYRIGSGFTNRVSYMRWAQAWMFRALAAYAARTAAVNRPIAAVPAV